MPPSELLVITLIGGGTILLPVLAIAALGAAPCRSRFLRLA